MTHDAPSSPDGSVDVERTPARAPEKRPRTSYLVYRRYRVFSRLAALVGGACGIALVAYSLLPSLVAGERVPLTSFAIGALLIAGMALVPYSLVRWRGSQLRARLDED